MTDLPTVLHVTAPADIGGLERVVFALARGARIRGHDVHVLAFVDAGVTVHPLVSELGEAGVPARSVALAARAYGAERTVLRDVVRATGARIVHTHGARVDVVDGPAARRLGLLTVSTQHGFTGGSWKNRFYEWLQVRAVRQGDAVVAVSNAMAGRLRSSGIRPERLHVIPNAWSCRRAPLDREAARRVLGVPRGGFRIGWVGRLTSEKGLDVLLESLASLRDLPVQTSVLGSGRQLEALQGRARALDVASRVTWHGPVPDADRLLTAFDVLVISSRTEGTPIVLFEAMAAGTPVVATAVGGIPDVVSADEAVLVPPERPDVLAAAVRRVFTDPEEAATRARAAGRVLAARYATDPWLDAYETLYARVAS